MVMRIFCLAFLLLTVTAAYARDFWDFPNVVDMSDDAEFVLFDPSLPVNDPDRRSRNISKSKLKALFKNQTTAWGFLTDKPSAFSPTVHNSTHGPNGSDPITVNYADLSGTPVIPDISIIDGGTW